MKWELKELEENLLVGSTLVEGTTLSEEQAHQVLAGRTISGHQLVELRELDNYRWAVERLMKELKAVPNVSEELILSFHHRLFEGIDIAKGRYKSYQNYTYRSDGSKVLFIKPSKVNEAMQKWLEHFNQDVYATPQQGAAVLYFDFENIHPFEDGNGRIGRVLISYWLHWKWQHSFRFYLKDKQAHINALHAANDNDLNELIRFFEQRIEKES